MSKPRILVVEDERVVAADIEELIEALGYEVAGTAATGTEALRQAVHTRPDLVLMDIKLKGALDGIDTAAAISQDMKIPVVYLTAHADAEILERAKKTAPAGYILKPFDERTLHTEIEIAFDRHRRQSELIEGGQRLSTALASIDEAVIVAHGGSVALMNRLAEDLTGWKQDEAAGKPLTEVFVILNGETGSLQPSALSRVQREGISIGLGGSPVLINRYGTRAAIQGSIAPVHRDDGKQGVCLLFRAVSQHAADENWGSPQHGAKSRLEMVGSLTTYVAARLSMLLEDGHSADQAAQLLHRLVVFAEREPAAAPENLRLNETLAGLQPLLQCLLGETIELKIRSPQGGVAVKADPGQIELMLIYLALSARESGAMGPFLVETTPPESGDEYAVLTIRPPENGRHPTVDLPALDEIARQSAGEIRLSRDDGAVHIYLPGTN